MTRKTETSVTLARGGMHSAARYRAFTKLIRSNTYKKTRLYHLILKGSTSQEDYRKAAEAIVRLLRDNNVPCFGKGCFEVNEERGLHFHFMLVVEAQYGKVDHWLTVAEDGPLKTTLNNLKKLTGLKDDPTDKKGIKVHIAPPGNAMHRRADGSVPLYQYISKSGPKLEDALVRVSYLYKKDSKDDSMTRIYYSTREKARNPEQAQPEQANEVTPTTNEGEQTMTITLTEAGHSYIKGHYKRFVEKELNVAEIRRALSDAGIPRTLSQVREDLSRYGFPEYAATHEGSLPPTLREVAEQEEGKKTKPARRLEFKLCPDYEASKRNSIADSIRRAAH